LFSLLVIGVSVDILTKVMHSSQSQWLKTFLPTIRNLPRNTIALAKNAYQNARVVKQQIQVHAHIIFPQRDERQLIGNLDDSRNHEEFGGDEFQSFSPPHGFKNRKSLHIKPQQPTQRGGVLTSDLTRGIFTPSRFVCFDSLAADFVASPPEANPTLRQNHHPLFHHFKFTRWPDCLRGSACARDCA
jgi:hypothetical protein